MAELERMVSQKVQSLHERVKAKEDAFRVRLICQAHLPTLTYVQCADRQLCKMNPDAVSLLPNSP